MTVWKTIETAPPSQADILLISQSGRMSVETGHYARNMLHASNVDGDECNYTHWTALPLPPTNKEKQ